MTLVWVGVAIVLACAAYFFMQSSKKDHPSVKNQHMERQEAPLDSLPEAYKGKTPIYQEYTAGDRHSTPNGMMVFADGQILRYADVIVKVKNGETTVDKGDLMWREEIKITEKGIEEIKELINNFEPKTHEKLDAKSLVHVTYKKGDAERKVEVGGKKTPDNYTFFTAVNRAISLNTINVVEKQ